MEAETTMTSQRLTAVLLVVMTGFGIPAVDAQSARDEAEIRDLQARQQEAWNRHDAKAYAALFTDDGDVVNVVGWWWKGQREIETQLTAAFAVVFRDSTLTIDDVQVRFPARDIAVAHVRWSMEGSKTPPGIPEPRQGIQIQVLQKRGREWRIAAFQNTSSLPETPFPTALTSKP
jgi:uncharacterized protein (TIGR02246 family)